MAYAESCELGPKTNLSKLQLASIDFVATELLLLWSL